MRYRHQRIGLFIGLAVAGLTASSGAHAGFRNYFEQKGYQAYDWVHTPQRFSPETVSRIDRGVERATPIVKGVRNCSALALPGAVIGGPAGAVQGCATGIGFSRFGAARRGFYADQAY